MLPEAGNSRKSSNSPKNESASNNSILYVFNLFFAHEFKNRHEKSIQCFRKPVILENRQMFQKMKVLVITVFYMYSTYFLSKEYGMAMYSTHLTESIHYKEP